MSNSATMGTAHTFVGLPVWTELFRFFRRHLATIAAIATFAFVLYQREWVSAQFSSGAWDIGAFYAAVFDWASIQSAFLFGIYAFVLGRTEPFIRAIADTSVFEQMRAHVRRTMYLALLLTVFAMPMLVAKPEVSASWDSVGLWGFTGVATLAAFTSFSFLKVVRVFRKVERINGKPKR